MRRFTSAHSLALLGKVTLILMGAACRAKSTAPASTEQVSPPPDAATSTERPSVQHSAAEAFAAFANAGIATETPAPFHTPAMFAATYCAGAHASGQDLMVIVCEYRDEVQATAGLEAARRAEPALGPRNLARHKSLVIRIMDREVYRTPGTKEAWTKLLSTFETLN